MLLFWYSYISASVFVSVLQFFFKCWSFPWWVHIVIFICVFVDVIWVVFVWGHLQIKLLWMPMDDSGFSGKHLWVWHLGHSVCEYMVGHVNHCFLKFLIFLKISRLYISNPISFPPLLSIFTHLPLLPPSTLPFLFRKEEASHRCQPALAYQVAVRIRLSSSMKTLIFRLITVYAVFCLHVCIGTTYMPNTRGSQKRALYLLRLELQTFLSHPTDSGNWTQDFWKIRQCS